MTPFERILFVTNNGVIVKLVKDRYDFGVRYHMYTPAQKYVGFSILITKTWPCNIQKLFIF